MGVSGDYLWDRSGRDPEVERLEDLLAPLALGKRSAPVRRRPWAGVVFAAAAAALLLAVLRLLPVGDGALRQDREYRYALGKFTAEKGSRVRVLREADDLIKLRLDRGTIHASISATARPRLFQVETPATTCVDLGCKYTLTVDADGRSRVHVTMGRVSFEDGTREVFIPAKGVCMSRPGRPGTPFWEDAAEPMAAAVRDFDEATPAGRAAAAHVVANLAEEARDTLMLWHFLQDPDTQVNRAGLDGLTKLFAAPDGVTREAVLRREKAALEAWRDHLRPEWHWW